MTLSKNCLEGHRSNREVIQEDESYRLHEGLKVEPVKRRIFDCTDNK